MSPRKRLTKAQRDAKLLKKQQEEEALRKKEEELILKSTVQPNSEYGKVSFVHLLAKRAGFTYGDTKCIVDAMEEIFFEILKNDSKLSWPNMLTMEVAHRKGWSVKTGMFGGETFPEQKMIKFKPSISMKKRLWGDTKINNTE